jgi:hypothetical protein
VSRISKDHLKGLILIDSASAAFLTRDMPAC